MTDKGDIYGVIDVGSNTIRLCIYNVTGDRITAMLNNKITAGLIGYVEDGVLSDRGIRRACDVLNTHRMMAERVGVKELFVFATASLRNIDNREEAVAEAQRQRGHVYTSFRCNGKREEVHGKILQVICAAYPVAADNKRTSSVPSPRQ